MKPIASSPTGHFGALLAFMTAQAVWSSPPHAQASPVTWQTAFPLRASAAGDIYFSARYFESSSGWHQLEVWRHGERFLHRRTDGKLDLYVVARAKGPQAYDYRVFDHRRHVAIDVDHGNLYRIGVFLDWFALAHVLDRPKQSHSLARTAARADEVRRGCDWILLERHQKNATRRSRICWSAKWGVPLRIRDNTHGDVWEDRFVIESVRAVGQGTVAWEIPSLPAGWARFDANKEIDPSQGD